MCGIVLLYGPRAQQRMSSCLDRLQHRGPDKTSTYHRGQLSMGFVRLAINDRSERGAQPIISGHLVAAVNGEIFNKQDLERKFQLPSWSDNDCHVIPLIFEKMAESSIYHLDGFYAGLMYDESQNRLFSLRDYIGKKPLFIGRSGSELFIVSELKAILSIEEFTALPLGCCEVQLKTGTVNVLASHKSLFFPTCDSTLHANADYGELAKLIELSVEKRLPMVDEPVGVFLSGGLDSSVLSAIVTNYRQDAVYYVLADETSQDFQFATRLIEYLGISQVRYVTLPKQQNLMHLIELVVYATESYNPSIVSNGLCSYLLASAAHHDGIKVVLSGEGADELFCGYHRFERTDDWTGIRQKLLLDMPFTELRRIDLACMAHSIECRCPFLDKDVFEYAQSLGFDDLYRECQGETVNKYALRAAFSSVLPDENCWREKNSFDVGSGIRKMVVAALTENGCSEKAVLKGIWNRFFKKTFSDSSLRLDKYFHSYPVFDQAISRRGVVHR